MWTSRFGRALAASFVGLGTLAGSALGAVAEPPAPGHVIVAFPERDFVSVEGYPAGADATFNIIRNGVTIGTAHVRVAQDGVAEINHPGGGCWEGITPDILPGDKVRVTVGSESDQTTTANVTAEPAARQGADIVVKGTAQDGSGNPLPLGQIDQRIIAPDLVALTGRRRLEAPGDGTLTYDAPGSIHWTARYTGLSNEVIDVALAGETRILWLGADPVAGSELTIFELGTGIAGGPSSPCTAPAARMAVTSLDRATINLDNIGSDVTVSGLAFNAASVTVRLSDGVRSTEPTTVIPGPSGSVPQTWSAVIPAAQIQGLADGQITAIAEYMVNGTAMSGVNKTFEKDTIAPPPPTATPSAGAYAAAQSVTLSHNDNDPATVIRYTVNGTDPSTASPSFTQQLLVTATQTVHAITVDRAGNRSAIADFPFVIGPVTVTGRRAIKAAPKVSRLRAVCLPLPAKPKSGQDASSATSVDPTAKRCRPGVSFVLSDRARITFVVTTKRGRSVGTFTRTLPGGKATVVLPAKVGNRPLAPGTYVLTVRARAAGTIGLRVTTTVTVPTPPPRSRSAGTTPEPTTAAPARTPRGRSFSSRRPNQAMGHASSWRSRLWAPDPGAGMRR
jgi:Chitobiase/beta-hexosaminidase C-terminal domain